MFKKSTKAEEPVKRKRSTVVKGTQHIDNIEYALNVLMAACENGQFVSLSPYNRTLNFLVPVPTHFKAQTSYGQTSLATLSEVYADLVIKSPEEIKAAEKKAKEEQLARLQQSAVETAASIEKLARELGQK